MPTDVKYSIILPTKNGIPFLKYACDSVLHDSRDDIELLVSVDSEDTVASVFLSSIKDARLRVLNPKNKMSMSEHWDYAQLSARGKWQMFLGQDDMLMVNYGAAFDAATDLAEASGTGVVVARRAYITWPPLREKNLKALQYWATNESLLRDSKDFVREALTSDISYHAGPQMYTTTLVSRGVINAIRARNDGRLILGHPQDAFLAASILRQSPNFLWLGSPFSWVGTSTKSAGLAITSKIYNPETSDMADAYARSVNASTKLVYESPIDFKHGVNARYFFDALKVVWPEIITAKPISTPLFKLKMDAGLIATMEFASRAKVSPRELITSPELAHLKRLLGLFIRLQRKAIGLLQKTASLLLRPYLKRRYSFQRIRSVDQVQKLFHLSRKFEAKFF
jgi:glycosyltransferase involved in cell wall biosynthesis